MRYYRSAKNHIYRFDGENWWMRNNLPHAKMKWIGIHFVLYNAGTGLSIVPPEDFVELTKKEAFLEML